MDRDTRIGRWVDRRRPRGAFFQPSRLALAGGAGTLLLCAAANSQTPASEPSRSAGGQQAQRELSASGDTDSERQWRGRLFSEATLSLTSPARPPRAEAEVQKQPPKTDVIDHGDGGTPPGSIGSLTRFADLSLDKRNAAAHPNLTSDPSPLNSEGPGLDLLRGLDPISLKDPELPQNQNADGSAYFPPSPWERPAWEYWQYREYRVPVYKSQSFSPTHNSLGLGPGNKAAPGQGWQTKPVGGPQPAPSPAPRDNSGHRGKT